MKIRPVTAEAFHKDGQNDEEKTDGQRGMANVKVVFFPVFEKRPNACLSQISGTIPEFTWRACEKPLRSPLR